MSYYTMLCTVNDKHTVPIRRNLTGNRKGTDTERVSEQEQNGYRMDIEWIQNAYRTGTERIQNGNGNRTRSDKRSLLGFF